MLRTCEVKLRNMFVSRLNGRGVTELSRAPIPEQRGVIDMAAL